MLSAQRPLSENAGLSHAVPAVAHLCVYIGRWSFQVRQRRDRSHEFACEDKRDTHDDAYEAFAFRNGAVSPVSRARSRGAPAAARRAPYE
jgi:hypothetical protein